MLLMLLWLLWLPACEDDEGGRGQPQARGEGSQQKPCLVGSLTLD